MTCDIAELQSDRELLQEAQRLRSQQRGRMRSMEFHRASPITRPSDVEAVAPRRRHEGRMSSPIERMPIVPLRRHRGIRGREPRKVPAPKVSDYAAPNLAFHDEIPPVISMHFACTLDAGPRLDNEELHILHNLSRDPNSALLILKSVCDTARLPLSQTAALLAQRCAPHPLQKSVVAGCQPPVSVQARCLKAVLFLIEKNHWAAMACTHLLGPRGILEIPTEDEASRAVVAISPTPQELEAVARSPLFVLLEIARSSKSSRVHNTFNDILLRIEKITANCTTNEKLSNSGSEPPRRDDEPRPILRHPRHEHDLTWVDIMRTHPAYARGGFICNICQVSSNSLCYHCSIDNFDLCANCSLDLTSVETQKKRTDRFLLLLLHSNVIVTLLSLLENIPGNTGGIVVLLKRCTAVLAEPQVIASDVGRRMLEVVQAFQRRVAISLSTAISAAIKRKRAEETFTEPGESPKPLSSVARMIEVLELEPKTVPSQLGKLFAALAQCSRSPLPEIRTMWNGIQMYLHEVSAVLAASGAPNAQFGNNYIPAAVLPLVAAFAEFHLTEPPADSSMHMERTETERLMGETTTPSLVSDRAAARTRSGDTDQKEVKVPGALFRFIESNRLAVNTLIHSDPKLIESSGALAFMQELPRLIDFEFKQAEFRRKLPSDRGRGSSININVSRHNCFNESFQQFRGRTAQELMGPLHVKFRDEEGADAGGLTREWFQLLGEEIVNPDYGLFIHSCEGMTFQPNPLSDVQPDHLAYFKFVGRVVALGVYNDIPMDVHFTRSVYRHLIGSEPCFRDVASIDPELFANMEKLLTMNVDESELELDFTISQDRFGVISEIELMPNGRNIKLTDANKKEYIRARCSMRMTGMIEEQLFELLSGFYDIIPRRLISVFTEQELELVISGMPEVDVEDLRVSTDYQGYSASSPQVRWFWECVASMSKQDRANLLQFATGSSKIPPGGFSHLEGFTGKQRFCIVRAEMPVEHLPLAHTCFNRIDLPPYPSAEVLREKLMLAITYGSKGFAML